MALVIDATVGGTSANSYATIAEIDEFVLSNPHDTTWDDVSDANKIGYAIFATRVINERIAWYGWVAVQTQALDFPRGGIYDKNSYSISSSIVPTDIKNGQAEMARLLVDRDRTADPDTKGYREIYLGPIRLNIDKRDAPRALPASVYNILQWYGVRTTKRARLLERV